MINVKGICSIREIALTLDLTTRRVRQLIVQGILPAPAKKGKYDFTACCNAYTAYQRKELRSLRARGKKQRKFKKLSPSELETWRNTVNAQLQEFGERLMNLRKRNDISNFELDLSELKKGGNKA